MLTSECCEVMALTTNWPSPEAMRIGEMSLPAAVLRREGFTPPSGRTVELALVAAGHEDVSKRELYFPLICCVVA